MTEEYREGYTMDTRDPDLAALLVTIGHASELTRTHGTPAEWAALTDALVSEHTPVQLANMLTGACAIIIRTTESPIL